MEQYIENLRKAGYEDFIQVVRIFIKEKGNIISERYYDYSKELSQQVDLHTYTLSSFGISFDNDKKLEVLCLNFDLIPVQFNEYLPSERILAQKPYWAALRKYIGHSIVYSSSCVAIIEKENKILAVKRTDDGMWSLPAGAKELGDGLETTMHIEAMEEVGVHLLDLKLIAIQTGQKMFWRYPNGNEMHYLSFIWKAKTNNHPKISDAENTEIRWVEIDEARKMFEPRWLKRLNYFIDYQGKLIID